ncbi:MAG: hypothetical protein A4S17_13365 [Proteobacteria bacterium HN_bin10]|nr:MAG: hypothetical protein A4S17_13365 [Proteobacteria bacterium HN_bin10]
MISGFVAALLQLGCATTGPQLPKHMVVVGRVVSSEEFTAFIPGGMDVTEVPWGRLYTFAPLATPTEHITFRGDYNCPGSEGGEEIYLVLLDRDTSLNQGRGEQLLAVVGCTAVDETRSAGLQYIR